jgi:hypothetical protein
VRGQQNPRRGGWGQNPCKSRVRFFPYCAPVVETDVQTLESPILTVAAAARIKSYRATPLGLLVGRYLRWFRNEWGATASTIRDYEPILARMALTLADRDPLDVTLDDLRDDHGGHLRTLRPQRPGTGDGSAREGSSRGRGRAGRLKWFQSTGSEDGGGGNRTRVRSRTVKSISKLSLPLNFARAAGGLANLPSG